MLSSRTKYFLCGLFQIFLFSKMHTILLFSILFNISVNRQLSLFFMRFILSCAIFFQLWRRGHFNVINRKLRFVRLNICWNIFVSLCSECLMIEILMIIERVLHLILFKMIFINIWLIDNFFGIYHKTKIHIFPRFIEDLHIFFYSCVNLDR